MNTIHLNPDFDDEKRRARIFSGAMLLYACTDPVDALTSHAKQFMQQTFLDLDPRKAQYEIPLAEFIEKVGALKSRFTNDLQTKHLIRDLLKAQGCDLDRTYFDVPRLRVVSSGNFLSSGVGYAYKAHRDTWYSSPLSQLNWWLPVYDLEPEQTMSMYPEYWAQAIKNSSAEFDYEEWCRVGRRMATVQGSKDERRHPLPQEEVDSGSEVRFVLRAGESLVFSAAHLHATAPNTSGSTRFSIDFRTINLDDLESGRQAPNVDTLSTGTTLEDFLRASDFSALPTKFLSTNFHNKEVV